MPLKLDYVTTADGWTAGEWRSKGAPLQLTPAQAQYENVVLADEAPKPAAKSGAGKPERAKS
ncbi:hypothetical protein [Phaeobacter inhibens]|uniref:hypothetical protein n=1 Tax=Phaeobacter inhibens TaxID=221822 RepID=UPI0021A647A8|nr:hypothetical protein [Phaeobacter inhibens]UWR50802.1 hypothetical protein K4F87_08675 [Phaeobacter inhibens]UWR67082.1 hypothetical protein K4K95_09900 [Phaeobacter inhibens]